MFNIEKFLLIIISETNKYRKLKFYISNFSNLFKISIQYDN